VSAVARILNPRWPSPPRTSSAPSAAGRP